MRQKKIRSKAKVLCNKNLIFGSVQVKNVKDYRLNKLIRLVNYVETINLPIE